MSEPDIITKVQHVGVRVTDFEWYRNFFENIMGMPVTLTMDDAEGNLDQIWIGGIQLQHAGNRTLAEYEAQQISHIGIETVDPDAMVATIAAIEGVTTHDGKPNWFMLPEGPVIEIVGKE